MTVTHTCSWCHAPAPAPIGTQAVSCPACGHRADLARLDCDCPACVARRPRPGGRPWWEVIFGPDHPPPAKPG